MANDTNETRVSERVSSLQRAIEERVANSLFRSLLRSRLHWLVSNWLVLLSYEGRRSGRRYTFPVAYKRIGDGIVVVTPMSDSNWWKNFQESQECVVWLRGTEYSANGGVVTDEERPDLILEYFDTYGILGRILGFGGHPASSPDQLAQAKRSLAVVRFDLDHRTH
jgi:hypothetical protein